MLGLVLIKEREIYVGRWKHTKEYAFHVTNKGNGNISQLDEDEEMTVSEDPSERDWLPDSRGSSSAGTTKHIVKNQTQGDLKSSHHEPDNNTGKRPIRAKVPKSSDLKFD